MTRPRQPSRTMREAAERREHELDLVEFIGLLVEALDVPEVRAHLQRALTPSTPRLSPPGRGRR
jgi:hypothetical protein